MNTVNPVNSPKKILVVDDEKKIVDIIAFNLRREGHEVVSAFDGSEGLRLALCENPDLIILDIMMPLLDGFEVCKRVREKSQAPIIMLTARSEEVDKVLALEFGADDYVTKPFGVRELMARVKANLRRQDAAGNQPDSQEALVFGDISFDQRKRDLYVKGELVQLTPKEYDLIKFLAINRDQVFSREALLEKVWGFEFFGDVRTVDVTVRRLRTKIEENSESPRYVMTKRGVGYYFGGA